MFAYVQIMQVLYSDAAGDKITLEEQNKLCVFPFSSSSRLCDGLRNSTYEEKGINYHNQMSTYATKLLSQN